MNQREIAVRHLPPAPPPADDDETRGPIERLVRLGAYRLVDDDRLHTLVRHSLDGLDLALCLHRVGDRPHDWLSIGSRELDALIELLRAARGASTAGHLTVTFDDGYDDAAEYVATRAPRYPDIEWLFFICPKPAEERGSFSWDAPRARGCELATLEHLRGLARLPNVSLGNHTNSHQRPNDLSDAELDFEYRKSVDDFERLFGEQQHFAFPFGSPGLQFSHRHVAKMRELRPSVIWSTERRPYLAAECRPGAVLPRFAINGNWTHRQTAVWISMLALKFRCLGSPHRY